MKIIAWNVNDSTNQGRGVQPPHQKAFAKSYSLNARWDQIQQCIADQNPSIVCLFELSSASLDFVESRLSEHFTTIKRCAYSPNQVPDMSLYFMIASKIELSNIHAFSCTDTPLIPLSPETRLTDGVLRSAGEMFEKTFLVAEFMHDGAKHILAVAHLGLRYAYQQICADAFANYLWENYRGVKTIVCGDFNTFSNESSYEMRTIRSFENTGMIERVRDRDTFCGYPSDIGILYTQAQKDNAAALMAFAAGTDDTVAIRRVCVETIIANHGKLITGGLDRVLTNIRSAEVDVIFTIPNLSKFMELVIDDIPHNPSDHACIVIRF